MAQELARGLPLSKFAELRLNPGFFSKEATILVLNPSFPVDPGEESLNEY